MKRKRVFLFILSGLFLIPPIWTIKNLISPPPFDGVYWTQKIDSDTKTAIRAKAVAYLKSKPEVLPNGSDYKTSWTTYFSDKNEPNLGWYNTHLPFSYSMTRADRTYNVIWHGDENCSENKRDSMWYDKNNQKCHSVRVTEIKLNRDLVPNLLIFYDFPGDLPPLRDLDDSMLKYYAIVSLCGVLSIITFVKACRVKSSV